MKRSRMIAAVMTAALALSVGVGVAASWAGTTGDQDALVATLEQQSKRLAEAARNTKGAPQGELLLRRARIRSLIDRLQKGEQVDPHEIDPLLR